MQATIGDIVELNGRHWVVAERVPGPEVNGPWFRIMSPGSPYGTSHITGIASLPVVERPAFEVGDRVRVNGRPGTVVALGERDAEVWVDAYQVPAVGGGNFTLTNRRHTVPMWALTLAAMEQEQSK